MKKKIPIIIFGIMLFAAVGAVAFFLGKKSAEKAIVKSPSEQTVKQTTPESVETPSPSSEGLQADQGKPVKIVRVEQQDIRVEQTFYGTAAPHDETNVQGKYGGKIVFLKGKEGDAVKKGEVIVRFDDSDTQLEFQRATANKNAAMEQVNQAQSNFETVKKDVERQQKLFDDGIISKKMVDDANNQLQAAQAALNSAREGVKQAEAQIQLIENTLSDFTLNAPIGGIIDLKQYNIDEIYRAGDVLYHLIDIDSVYVELEVPETYIAQVREGMPVEVVFDSLQDRKFTGVIENIIPKSDPQSRNFLTKALVQNPEHSVKPGMFARVNVSVQNLPGALIIDRKALVKEGEQDYVFKVVDNQVKKIAVAVKYQEDVTVAVASDELQPGDQVVIEGAGSLKADDRVKIQ